MPAAVDSVRVLDFSRDVRENLHGFVHRHLGDVERLLAALLSAAGLAPPARKPGSDCEVREPRVRYRPSACSGRVLPRTPKTSVKPRRRLKVSSR
jgi:hypothetical protein